MLSSEFEMRDLRIVSRIKYRHYDGEVYIQIH